jgi:hypothetical protein
VSLGLVASRWGATGSAGSAVGMLGCAAGIRMRITFGFRGDSAGAGISVKAQL